MGVRTRLVPVIRAIADNPAGGRQMKQIDDAVGRALSTSPADLFLCAACGTPDEYCQIVERHQKQRLAHAGSLDQGALAEGVFDLCDPLYAGVGPPPGRSRVADPCLNDEGPSSETESSQPAYQPALGSSPGLGYPFIRNADPPAMGHRKARASFWLVRRSPQELESRRTHRGGDWSCVVHLVPGCPFHQLPGIGAPRLFSAASGSSRAVQVLAEPNVPVRTNRLDRMDDLLRKPCSLRGAGSSLVIVRFSRDSIGGAPASGDVW